MLRERHINGDPRGRFKRFLAAAADGVRWPFERVLWAGERAVVWPLQERLAGWIPAGRSFGAGALAVVAAAAVLAGVLLLPGGSEPTRERVAAPARVAIETSGPRPQAVEKPSGPVLQGVAPSFDVGKGAGVAKAGSGSDGTAEAEGGDELAATDDGEAAASEAGASASSSSRKPVPAGPAAMKVARRFSEAFVFYEVGERPGRAKTVFAATAAPQLAEALSKRPPRQPGEGEVPKAKVLNLVPGPRAGKAYTVSASLLRIGLTSELRLELNKKKGQWLVTDVRG
ncbi:MAG TPA: hypothetical protein VFT19_13405 [Solirubrobacterales bacterium]|nr:hypothetical protein [Solirubrobacterales bacterium]